MKWGVYNFNSPKNQVVLERSIVRTFPNKVTFSYIFGVARTIKTAASKTAGATGTAGAKGLGAGGAGAFASWDRRI